MNTETTANATETNAAPTAEQLTARQHLAAAWATVTPEQKSQVAKGAACVAVGALIGAILAS